MHHLVNGLSLEVTRQAVQILGRMVKVTLLSSVEAERPEPEAEPEEQTPEQPTGQYL